MRTVIAAIVAGLVCWPFPVAAGRRRSGADKDAMKAVDALYTAVGLRDEKLVDECGGAAQEPCTARGRFPNPPSTPWKAIIAQAKDGKWEPAQTAWAVFMEGQTR